MCNKNSFLWFANPPQETTSQSAQTGPQHFAHSATQRKRYAGPIDSAFRLQMTAVCAQMFQMTARKYHGRLKTATISRSLGIRRKTTFPLLGKRIPNYSFIKIQKQLSALNPILFTHATSTLTCQNMSETQNGLSICLSVIGGGHSLHQVL